MRSLFISIFTLLLSLTTVQKVWAVDYVPNTDYPAPEYLSTENLTSSGTTVTVPLITYLGGETNAFCRFFLADAQTMQPLYDLSSNFVIPSDKSALVKNVGYGCVEFPRWNYTRKTIDITLNKPEGKAWTDLVIVVLKKTFTATNITNENTVLASLGITESVLNTLDNLDSDPNSWSDYKVYTIDNPRTAANQTFSPYEGVVSATGDFETSSVTGAKRQHTHSWSYDYYVEPGTKVELKAPIVDKEWIEYRNYWRWYDNNTFKANDQLTTSTSIGSLLKNKFTDSEGRSEGLFYYTDYTGWNGATLASWSNMAEVVYNAPDDDSWTGADIAADASRYADGLGYDGTSMAFREPTLSTRFIWHIHPAKEIADKVKQAILGGNAYEDHGNITIALSSKQSKAMSALRLDLRDIDQYWYYPYRMSTYGKAPTELDFNSQYIQCKSVSWAAHVRNGDKLYYKYLGTGSRFNTSVRYNLYASDVQGVYYNVSDANDTIHIDTLKTGREFAIIAYANSQTYSSTNNLTAPIARFSCYFITQVHPQKASEVSTHRTIERLEKNYTRVGLINFDDEEGMTFEAPAQIYKEGATNNNSWHKPIEWNRSYFGFVYPQLAAADKSAMGYQNFGKYGNYHGDYSLVKEAGSTVAFTGAEGYRWWYNTDNKGRTLHDRTYDLTNGQRSGYFLYVDAADEARPIASLDFEANLCSGSTLILSAAVADLTSGATRPQLLFKLYGVKYDDQHNIVSRQLIQSFSSGDFLSHEATDKAVWYQVFAKTFIHPNASAEQFSNFTVTIDNNCQSTAGADYAIDDIRFYVANDQVEVLQLADKDDLCEKKSNGAYLKLRMDYSMISTFLKAYEREKPFYYRICTSDGTPVTSVTYPEDDIHEVHTDNNGVPYGAVWIKPTELENKPYLENDVYGYARYVVANTFFQLDPTKEYYISGALPIETVDAQGQYHYAPGFWGNPGTPCSVYSKIVNINQQDFVITSGNGQTVSKFYAECGEEIVNVTLSAKLSIPDAVYGGRKEIDWKFDWVIGNEDIFEEYKSDGYLTALQHYRQEYPDASSDDFWSNDPKGVYSEDDQIYLQIWLLGESDTFADDILLIFPEGSNTLNRIIHMPSQGTIYTNIYYIPIPGEYTDPETGAKYQICPDPIKGRLELSHLTPQIYLGFPTVTYPDDLDRSAKYIRLGLKQANELKKGTLLSIPINGYRDATLNEGSDRHNLSIEEDNGSNVAYPCKVRLVETNDPTVNEDQIAKFTKVGVVNRYGGGKVAEVIPDDHIITPESQTISIDFSQNQEMVNQDDGTIETVTDDLTFHEGYDYRFVITYHDATKTIGGEEGTAICYAYTYFTLRIIPEYVTWTGAVAANTNWNNDLNWRRSSRAELNLPFDKSKTAATDESGDVNTGGGAASTSDMAENYLEYGCTELADKEGSGLQQSPDANKPGSTPQAFVPMKFTKVTINPGTSFPYLGNYEVDSRQGIITNLQNPNLSEGTEYIAYDLMVKETPENNAYGCERFYANTCKEVYFRTDKTDLPQGEGQIRNQHYLDYKKAWVDLSIHPDQWNWFASPLNGIYAGDFYLPKSTGQQNTEAFQPITFNTTDYGRAAYPVFQRNWNAEACHVVTNNSTLWPEGWYDAQVPYEPTDSVELMMSEWSHAYNDVTQAYAPGHGFSLMPLRTDGSVANSESALFRLPKADTSYDYYDYQGTGPATGITPTTLDRSMSGLLATNSSTADDPRKLTGTLTLSTDALGHRNGLILVGNPYMGTLEMSSFFNDNPGLYRKYWTLDENGTLEAFGGTDDELGKVAPMRAFFVKSQAGDNTMNIRFLPSQCTTVFYAVGQSASAGRELHLIATTDGGRKAVATIKANPEANDDFVETEDVETLFDSNLTENGTPQLYTVAGNRAAAINSVSDLRNVALGITTVRDEEVSLTITGVNTLSAPLYLYDAKTRQLTPVLEDEPIRICSNSPGRYLLTSKAMTPASDVRTALRCYPTGKQGGVVASTAPEDRLTQIQVFDTLGRLQREMGCHEPVQQFTLPKGMYLITLTSEAVTEGRTFKVMVK